ncbi:ABC-F family ATP-binding cassette domain-containing protein [Paenibacillus mesophilus]|uniref:ribosomal protection-like ABC-F family protein n=1 Tax=Paenibacillus mesophilus TaxID=2582849 RepID=UPI00110E43A4|nr:ABC-F family ATP-binding cassette domain-containing protein [Paenibacillus mesophilus]TMV50122.1 ABC-F family ATP-binding cassette domain-containing protein [Paenibacillus mesophilus]
MILCAADKIAKMWGGTPVIQQLSLEIHEGERIGMVGPNGCGKTTLLKLLSGAEPPDSGTIHYKKGCQAALLAQIPNFGHEETVMDVLKQAFAELLGIGERMSRLEAAMADPDQGVMEKALKEYGILQEAYADKGGYEMDANLARVADGLGIVHLLQTPFRRLSGGERTKVGLGRILLLEPDLLLLDEPTNHLDLQAVEWLETYLRDYRGSVMIVSHDRYFLDRVVTKIYDLEGGTVDVYHGNYAYFVEEKERRLLAEFAAYQEQQKKIAKMEEAIKRMRIWAAQADNPYMFKRAASMQKALDRIEKLGRPVLERKRMGLAFEMGERSGKDVIVMEGVGKSYRREGTDGDGDADDRNRTRLLYKDVNLHVRFREFVAIVGENGSGKSTLLRMIAERLEPDAGTVRIGSGVKIGYLAQHDLFPDETKTIVDAFRDRVPVEEGEARHILAKFLFYGASVFRKVNDLSGGERMRLRLAQLMHQDMNVLVLDEPTNHLDIDSRESLEETLAAFPGTIVCVSHDRYLLNKLFPVTYWLEEGALTRYEGRYEEARSKHAELRAAAAAAPSGRGDDAKPKPDAGKSAEADRSDRRLAKLEAEINTIESKIALLEAAMMREEQAEKLSAMHEKKSLLEAERELLYERLDTVE